MTTKKRETREPGPVPLVVLMLVLSSVEARSQPATLARVTADFQNLLFLPAPPPGAGTIQAAAAFFGGNVAPAGRPGTPTDGARILEICAFGQPVAPVLNPGLFDCQEGADYRAWAQARFGEAMVQDLGRAFTLWGRAADPDHDLRDNLMEFALGSNPLVADAHAGIELTLTGGNGTNQMTALFLRQADSASLAYLPAVSGDLIEWFSDASHLAFLGAVPAGPGVERASYRDLALGTPGNPLLPIASPVPGLVRADSCAYRSTHKLVLHRRRTASARG